MITQFRGRLVALSLAFTALAFAADPAPDMDDPYLWLENVDSTEALAWVTDHNQIALDELTPTAIYRETFDRLRAIFDSRDRIPAVVARDGWYYNFWQDAAHTRGIWRRTRPASYATAQPEWETLLDLDALAAAEAEPWVWKGSVVRDTDHRRALIQLSRGGGDATVVREFDLSAKAFVADGFFLPEAKSDVTWADDDTLLVATDFGPDSLTQSGYPRIVKRWRRGTPLAEATTVFAGDATDVSTAASVSDAASGRKEVIYQAVTFYTSNYYLADAEAPLTPLPVPADAQIDFFQNYLLVSLRSDWAPADVVYPAGALLAVDFEAFMQGERAFDVLFRPEERVSLDSFTTTKNYVVVNTLNNVSNRITTLRPAAEGWTRQDVATPAFGTASVRAVDSDHNDDLFLTLENFLQPATLSLVTLGETDRTALKRSPAFFDTAGLDVTQHEAVSADGTKIPYFQVARAGLKLDGSNPTLLYGYGGFEVSMTPGYLASAGAGWMERGGVYILSNIRGGGEFGPAWHQAALKENRQRAYDDFAAIAEDLIARGVTSPRHLGIMGGSNGGLLMGVMLTQRPELFGAVVCQVPLLDMMRYHLLLAGASWMGEYGDPEVPAERAFIRAYSPYQNLRADRAYPRTLFVTSTRDDRVHPGHARKMAARMEEQGHDFLYWENTEGGHGGATNNEQRAKLWALSFAFLWRELGGAEK